MSAAEGYSDVQLIAKYLELRDTIGVMNDEHAKKIKPFADAMDLIEGVFLARFIERAGPEGPANTKTEAGTAYRSRVATVKVVDRGAFLEHCIRNWQTGGSDMLQVGAVKDPVKQYLEEHEDARPPGVTVEWRTNINIRKT